LIKIKQLKKTKLTNSPGGWKNYLKKASSFNIWRDIYDMLPYYWNIFQSFLLILCIKYISGDLKNMLWRNCSYLLFLIIFYTITPNTKQPPTTCEFQMNEIQIWELWELKSKCKNVKNLWFSLVGTFHFFLNYVWERGGNGWKRENRK
jgi:hypothetical protein